MAVAAAAAVALIGGTVWVTTARDTMQSTSAGAPVSAESAGSAADQQAEPSRALADSGAETTMKKSVPKPTGSVNTYNESVGTVFEGKGDGVRVTVTAFPDGRLTVGLEGVPVGTTCRLLVLGSGGQRDLTDAWTLSRAEYEEKSVFSLATEVPMADIAEFRLVDKNDKVLARVPVNGRG